MSETAASVVGLSIVIAWLASSGYVLRFVFGPSRSLLEAIAPQAIGNLLVAGAALAVLSAADVSSPFPSPDPPVVVLAVLIGTGIALVSSRFAAGMIGRTVAPAELAIASLPLRHRLLVLLTVPVSEELLWRAAPIPALVALGVPFALSIVATGVASIAVHRRVFSDRNLMKATVPPTVGESIAVALGGLPAVVAVHVASDLEILVTSART